MRLASVRVRIVATSHAETVTALCVFQALEKMCAVDMIDDFNTSGDLDDLSKELKKAKDRGKQKGELRESDDLVTELEDKMKKLLNEGQVLNTKPKPGWNMKRFLNEGALPPNPGLQTINPASFIPNCGRDTDPIGSCV